MLLVVCAVFDAKVQAFNAPNFFRTKGEAIRSFSDACADGKSGFVAHPEDYIFFHLGLYDQKDGKMSSLPAPEPLCKALDFVSVSKEV